MISLRKTSHAEYYFNQEYPDCTGETLLDKVFIEFKIKDIDPVENLLHAILEKSGVGEIADYQIRFWSYQSKYICN